MFDEDNVLFELMKRDNLFNELIDRVVVPNVHNADEYEQGFVDLMEHVIRRCRIDPEEAPQLMERVWEQLNISP